jgi:hypothetical protein
MANNEGVIKITEKQAQQISSILNELPIRELAKVRAIIDIFNSTPENKEIDEVKEFTDSDEN